MVAITFDTLEFSRTLQSSGFSQEQADAMAKVQHRAMKEMVATQELVTKADLERTKKEIMERLIELDSRINESKHETLKWIMGMFLAQTAMLIAVISFIK